MCSARHSCGLTFFLEFTSSQSEALVYGQKYSKTLIHILALNKKIHKSKSWISSSLVRSSHPSAKGRTILKLVNAREINQSGQPGWHTAHGLLNIEAPMRVCRSQSPYYPWWLRILSCMSHNHCIELSPYQPLALLHGTRRACYKPADTSTGFCFVLIFFSDATNRLCQQPVILSQQNVHISQWARLGL